MRRDDPAGLILVVEDNRNLSEMVGEYLESKGFGVDYAGDGMDGYRLAADNSYDVIVLDLMLPRLDGLEVCRKLRNEAKKSTPVLMLTARDTLNDKVVGLEAGADDYLVKPFDLAELSARIGSVARRYGGNPNPLITHGPLQIDLTARSIHRDSHPVQLTAREWALLEAFLSRRGQLLSKAQLEDKLYAFDAEVESNTIEVHVSRLRKKLGADVIVTERGLGYRLGPA